MKKKTKQPESDLDLVIKLFSRAAIAATEGETNAALWAIANGMKKFAEHYKEMNEEPF